MHSRSAKFISYTNANEVVHELFESLHSIYPGNLETLMEEVILFLIQFNCCIQYHKVNFKGGASYIDSPDWI